MVQSERPDKKCPYCGHTFKPKGLHLHVYLSKDDDHGPAKSVPEDFDKYDVELVNNENRNQVTKSSSRSSENHLYLCHYCNGLYEGEQGLKIHLSKSKGDHMHPEDVSTENEEYTLIPADEDYNPFMDTEEIYEITKRRRRRNEIMKDF